MRKENKEILRKKLGKVVCSLICIYSFSAGFFAHLGWTQTVIPISNITDLQKIGNDPNYPLDAHYELTQDIDASETYTWNNSEGFRPIGSSSPFIGTFDGKGFKISNLYIRQYNGNHCSLFKELGSGAVVKGIKIEGIGIERYYGGSIASIVQYGATIENCHYISGWLEFFSEGGGIAYLNQGTIRQCS